MGEPSGAASSSFLPPSKYPFAGLEGLRQVRRVKGGERPAKRRTIPSRALPSFPKDRWIVPGMSKLRSGKIGCAFLECRKRFLKCRKRVRSRNGCDWLKRFLEARSRSCSISMAGRSRSGERESRCDTSGTAQDHRPPGAKGQRHHNQLSRAVCAGAFRGGAWSTR